MRATEVTHHGPVRTAQVSTGFAAFAANDNCVLRLHYPNRLGGQTGTAEGNQVPSGLRYLCIACTTTEPSPTLEATRLTEPERTSPTAKMPGTVVA